MALAELHLRDNFFEESEGRRRFGWGRTRVLCRCDVEREVEMGEAAVARPAVADEAKEEAAIEFQPGFLPGRVALWRPLSRL